MAKPRRRERQVGIVASGETIVSVIGGFRRPPEPESAKR
jgi:hypothetical protein